jgi:hypothetical protein
MSFLYYLRDIHKYKVILNTLDNLFLMKKKKIGNLVWYDNGIWYKYAFCTKSRPNQGRKKWKIRVFKLGISYIIY